MCKVYPIGDEQMLEEEEEAALSFMQLVSRSWDIIPCTCFYFEGTGSFFNSEKFSTLSHSFVSN